jgi:SAM-dependent methyltransferase
LSSLYFQPHKTEDVLMIKEIFSKRPRIISFSVVKNEQDIIEPFIRHNSRFLDFMIILDNHSNDDTRRVIVELMRELGNVVLTDQAKFGHMQSERITGLLHFSQTAFFADYIVLLDADEFIDVSDRAAFQSILRKIPLGGFGLIPWRTFVLAPCEADTATLDPPRSMKWCRTTELPLYKKAILNLNGFHFHDLIISQGNHLVFSSIGRKLPSRDLPELVLDHFPVRSRNQLVVKSIVGWMAYLKKNPEARKSRQGYQKRDNFDYFADNPNADYDCLCERSLGYAQDRPGNQWQEDVIPATPPDQYTRNYSTGDFGDPISVIAKAWESSLSSPQPILTLTARDDQKSSSGTDTSTSFDPSGHWNNLFVDIPPFRFISEKYRPDSVLDVGCGVGAYLELFKRLGATTIFGIDGIPGDVTVLDGKEYAVHDLSNPFDLEIKFDLVICVEVVEYLDDIHAARLLTDIAQHASGRIIFAAAEPGQPGHLHINCRPIDEWLRRWQTLGWVPDLNDSLAMRSLSTLSWLRRNVFVLVPASGIHDETAIQVLKEIGNRPFTWYSQAPGIREEILSEEPPQPPFGYISHAVSASNPGWLRKIAGWLGSK